MAAPPTTPDAGWRGYLELTKPGITGLIVFVAVGGYFLVAPARLALLPLALLVLTGTAASAGAAMLNHYLDRDLDAAMRRTRGRPLPVGAIPGPRAALLGTLLLAVGVLGASLLLNPLTGLSILLGGLTYVVVYTIWLKRRSSWNIVVGGFAGSAPALAASAAVTGTWTAGALALALLVFLWTPPHFWSLAIRLREDYRSVGLPMLPQMDDPGRSAKVVVVSAALLLPPTALLLAVAPITWPVALLLVADGLLFVALAAPLWRSADRASALRSFVYSGIYLIVLLAGLIANWALLSIGIARI